MAIQYLCLCLCLSVRCRNDEVDNAAVALDVEYREDGGETSRVLRALRIGSPLERCDDKRAGGDGDLFGRKSSIFS